MGLNLYLPKFQEAGAYLASVAAIVFVDTISFVLLIDSFSSKKLRAAYIIPVSSFFIPTRLWGRLGRESVTAPRSPTEASRLNRDLNLGFSHPHLLYKASWLTLASARSRPSPHLTHGSGIT